MMDEPMVEVGNRIVHLADVEIVEGLIDAGYDVVVTADRRVVISPPFHEGVVEHLNACPDDVEAIAVAYFVKVFTRELCRDIAARLAL